MKCNVYQVKELVNSLVYIICFGARITSTVHIVLTILLLTLDAFLNRIFYRRLLSVYAVHTEIGLYFLI